MLRKYVMTTTSTKVCKTGFQAGHRGRRLRRFVVPKQRAKRITSSFGVFVGGDTTKRLVSEMDGGNVVEIVSGRG